jgi:hypothetical protein
LGEEEEMVRCEDILGEGEVSNLCHKYPIKD